MRLKRSRNSKRKIKSHVGFMCVGLSADDDGFVKASDDVAVAVERSCKKISSSGGGAFNTTKHLWAGAIAAMVSRY